jgi:hypothetical protein
MKPAEITYEMAQREIVRKNSRGTIDASLCGGASGGGGGWKNKSSGFY